MNNNNKISEIMQALISKTELEKICLKYGYEDTARKLTVHNLLKYFTLSAILESKSYRDLSLQGSMYNLVEVNYSTLSKKAKEVPFEIFLEVFHLIFEKCNRKDKRKIRSKYGRIIKIVDSTRIILDKSKWKWAEYEKGKSGLKFHTAYLLDSEIPCNLVVSPIKTGDSTVLEMFEEQDTLLVCDRGYLNIKKMCEFDYKGQEFIIRMKETVNELNCIDFDISRDSSKYEDHLCTLGKDKSIRKEYREHQFRVINFLSDSGELVSLCTNIYDLPADEIAEIYKLRWQIECFFKELKQNFTIKNIFGKSPNAAFSQGIIAFICYIFIHCLYSDIKAYFAFNFSFVEFLRRLKYNYIILSFRKFCKILTNIFS